MIKTIEYDFGLDTFISITAPIGTDPNTLITQAIDRFKERLTEEAVEVQFLQTFDPAMGT